jgi:ABC-type multidrug transport system fused ATPase/permease subunit
MSSQEILETILPNFNEDLIGYIISIFDEMSLSEKHNQSYISETLSPFLLDTEYCSSHEIDNICKQIVIAFGGSGYKSSTGGAGGGGAGHGIHHSQNTDNDLPQLLSAPVKIKDVAGLDQIKQTYGGVVLMDINHPTQVATNESLDMKDIPTNQRSKRKLKRDNEQLARKLRLESALMAEQRQAMAAARMAAIKASRNASKSKAITGLHLECFSLPHPSGTGDLFTDLSLNLNYGSRYGLIGRNGAGKTTLMKALANYSLPGLDHLKILLVDQHVEGDEETPIQVCPCFLFFPLLVSLCLSHCLPLSVCLSLFPHGITSVGPSC